MTSKQYTLLEEAIKDCKEKSAASIKDVQVVVEINKGTLYFIVKDYGFSVIVACNSKEKTAHAQTDMVTDLISKKYNAMSVIKNASHSIEELPKKFTNFNLQKIVISDKLNFK